MHFIVETGVQRFVCNGQTRAKLIIGVPQIFGLLFQVPVDVLKFRINDIREFIFELFQFFTQQLYALIDLLFGIILLIQQLLVLFTQFCFNTRSVSIDCVL